MNKRPWWRRPTAERRMNCLQVARVMQAYLDGETDEITARRAAAHLEDCRRCGLELSVYQEIRNALARRAEPDRQAVQRLQTFGASLLSNPPVGEDGPEN
ncbi:MULTISPECIES: zf-HC2 domain-containing protein [unclassified Streptomyces]|uniref:anti-sigma factor family protein n=1 Tax=unclassified Streptomyces TaxID=2593676 RepID=UPI0027E59F02|nr:MULTISPECIES: zf-HC2 domain-containing protein [unclassified Streptomyces]